VDDVTVVFIEMTLDDGYCDAGL